MTRQTSGGAALAAPPSLLSAAIAAIAAPPHDAPTTAVELRDAIARGEAQLEELDGRESSAAAAVAREPEHGERHAAMQDAAGRARRHLAAFLEQLRARLVGVEAAEAADALSARIGVAHAFQAADESVLRPLLDLQFRRAALLLAAMQYCCSQVALIEPDAVRAGRRDELFAEFGYPGRVRDHGELPALRDLRLPDPGTARWHWLPGGRPELTAIVETFFAGHSDSAAAVAARFAAFAKQLDALILPSNLPSA